ncbi:MAG: tetratricopeptide repeat protein [Proteobacteria bacterium]|nr:tetratricopeptide repeat protein [Pseudomonadota bacterium]
MDRVIVRTAFATFALLWVTGCASSSDLNANALTGKQAASVDDSQLGTPGRNLADNLDGEIRRAQLLRTAGDFDAASKSLSQLMLVAPDDPRVVGEYGKVLTQRGQTQDALAFLKRAIELQPADWTLFSALGVAYDQMDDRANAKLAYEHALLLKPGEATVLNNYAVSRMLAGDLDGAQTLLAQAAAQGTQYAKIGNNVQMVANLQKQRGQAVSDVAVAKAKAKQDAKEPMVAKSTPRAPVATQALPPIANNTVNATVASAKTPDAKTVVMQQVPFDPKAGPVKTRVATKPPRKLASATAPATPSPTPAKRPAPKQLAKESGPKLRTASGETD